MGKGPGFFGDIGKKIKDLFGDYSYNEQVKITATTESGVTFVTSGTQKGDSLNGDVKVTAKSGGVTFEGKIDTNSKVNTTVTMDEVAQGLKMIVSGVIPDLKSGKLEAKYTGKQFGLQGSLGLVSSPKVECSCATGSNGFSLGAECGYDTAKSIISKYTAAVGYSTSDYVVSAILADKASTLKMAYVHQPSAARTIGAEVVHKLNASSTTVTLGLSEKLDSTTSYKVKMDSNYILSALWKCEVRKGTTVTLCSEVNTKALDKAAKLGINMAFKN